MVRDFVLQRGALDFSGLLYRCRFPDFHSHASTFHRKKAQRCVGSACVVHTQAAKLARQTGMWLLHPAGTQTTVVQFVPGELRYRRFPKP
jgi:hypothetical protein